jgi:hypothetical protein
VATTLSILTAIVLIVAMVLAYAYSGRRRRRASDDGVFARLWASLDPIITDKNNWEGNTTQSLRRIAIASILFGATVAAWAIGASVMRTIWLYQTSSLTGIPKEELAKHAADWTVWAVTLLQIVRGVGGTLALCAAAGLAGAALGFLFGLPQPPAKTAAAAPNNADKTANPNPQGDRTWRLNSNLMDISDWLTKAIVGVSLFEAQRAFGLFGGKTQLVAQWLFESRGGSYAVLPAAMAGAAVLGFLFTNLHTQLVVSGLFAEADRRLKSLPGGVTRATLSSIKNIREGLVPRISRALNVPEPLDQPTPDEVEAAMEYIGMTFDDLKSRPEMTREDVRSWARAMAVLNNYREAVQGYMYLLGKNSNG